MVWYGMVWHRIDTKLLVSLALGLQQLKLQRSDRVTLIWIKIKIMYDQKSV